jgi:hypothetical protein
MIYPFYRRTPSALFELITSEASEKFEYFDIYFLAYSLDIPKIKQDIYVKKLLPNYDFKFQDRDIREKYLSNSYILNYYTSYKPNLKRLYYRANLSIKELKKQKKVVTLKNLYLHLNIPHNHINHKLLKEVVFEDKNKGQLFLQF